MIKEVGTFSKYTVIETYIDSQNSYGATIRTGIRIKIDNYKSWSYGGVAFRNPNDAFFGVFLP